MPRRLAQSYACPALERLARQMLFVPPERRIDQVRRAEKLHDQIDPDTEYPYEFIAYRVTGYRSKEEADTLLAGSAILPDLRLLIDTVSRSMTWPADEAEPVESAAELAARLNVSTKTVARWRRLGLRWRWTGDPGYTRGAPKGRQTQNAGNVRRKLRNPKSEIRNPSRLKPTSTRSGKTPVAPPEPAPPRPQRLVFPRSGVERFLATQGPSVARATRFSRMTPRERGALLSRARRIAEAVDASPNRVATHLARRTGRAVETVRTLLEEHDRDHPDNPVFADRTKPLSPEQANVIARAYRMGVSVGKIGRHFRRTRTTIYRTIHERRAAALRQRVIRFVTQPIFARADADEVLLRPETPADDGPQPAAALRAPGDDLPQPLHRLFSQPALDAERQRSLLVRFNYLKFKADVVRGTLDRFEPRAAQLDQVDALLAQADALLERLLLANAPTILSVARRHLVGQSGASPLRLLEHLEQGQDVLVEAIEAYDPSRAQTFDAYLTWALMRRFATQEAEPRTRPTGRPDPAAMLPRLRQALARLESQGRV